MPVGPEPIDTGNELFQAAALCILLDRTFAACFLRDRLHRAGTSIRSVTAAELRALLPELERAVLELAGERVAKASGEALRGLLAVR